MLIIPNRSQDEVDYKEKRVFLQRVFNFFFLSHNNRGMKVKKKIQKKKFFFLSDFL